ncbi:MAG: hypothetical protein ACKOUT_10000 [Novosphingobium sp.]
MDQSATPSIADPVARLEQAIGLSKAREKLESALSLLDSIGADLAAAHVAQAIDVLRMSFRHGCK